VRGGQVTRVESFPARGERFVPVIAGNAIRRVARSRCIGLRRGWFVALPHGDVTRRGGGSEARRLWCGLCGWGVARVPLGRQRGLPATCHTRAKRKQHKAPA